MATALIQIARREREYKGRTGPKAAFDFFQNLTVPTVADRQAEVLAAGNKKQQFEAFCALYGSQFGDGRTSGSAVVHSEEQREELTEKLARLLSKDTDSSVGVQVFDGEADTEVIDHGPIVELLAGILGVDAEALRKVAAGSASATTRTKKATPSKPAPKDEATVVATRISWPMCGILIRAAKVLGSEFKIVDKTGKGDTANYTVTFDGHTLTPAEASEIIGAYKAGRKAK